MKTICADIKILPYGQDRRQVFDGDFLLATFSDLEACRRYAEASQAKPEKLRLRLEYCNHKKTANLVA